MWASGFTGIMPYITVVVGPNNSAFVGLLTTKRDLKKRLSVAILYGVST